MPQFEFQITVDLKSILSSIFVIIIPLLGFAQHSITGTVLDDSGQVLNGANVTLVDTQNGTIADEKGQFTLDGLSGHNKIEISFLGYFSKEISLQLNENTDLGVIILISKSEMLDLLTIKASRVDANDPFTMTS